MAVDDLWHKDREEGWCPDCRVKHPPSKEHGRGMRWRVRYIDHDDKRRAKRFDKEKDATAFDKTIHAAYIEGRSIDIDQARMTVEQYGETWQQQQRDAGRGVGHHVTTQERVERSLRLHVYGTDLGKKKIGDVLPKHIHEWRNKHLAEGKISPSTLNVIYRYVKSIFRMAKLNRVITFNPCDSVAALPIDKPEPPVLTTDQVHALAAGLPPRYRALPLVAAGSGLRQGELWGLEVDHVDLQNAKIKVSQQAITMSQPGRKRRLVLGPPKTESSRRTVEIAGMAVDALARHIEEFPPVDFEIDDWTNPRKPVTRRTAKLIFVNNDGRPLTRDSWSHIWTPVVRRLRLPEGFTFHDLRNFYTTALIDSGADPVTVKDMLGHKKTSTLFNNYAGRWPKAPGSVRDRLDKQLGR